MLQCNAPEKFRFDLFYDTRQDLTEKKKDNPEKLTLC